jgi:hypothetical protein
MATLTSGSSLDKLKDNDWVRQALFTPHRTHIQANARDNDGRFSIGQLMFEDTALGGGRFMNPKPQPCRLSDPKVKSLIASVKTDLSVTGSSTDKLNPAQTFGMGRWYAEKINQHQQYITIQVGIPQFNSIGNFMSSFYDPGQAILANTGSLIDAMAVTLLSTVGSVTVWALCPIFSLLSVGFSTGRKAFADLQNRPLSKFYYISPQMTMYWSTVQNIINALVVNLKLQGGVAEGDLKRKGTGPTTVEESLTKNDVLKELGRILPDIYLADGGGIDVRVVANRYERLAIAHQKKLQGITERTRGDAPEWEDVASDMVEYFKTGLAGPVGTAALAYPTLKSLIDGYRESGKSADLHLIDKLMDAVSPQSAPNKKADTVTVDSTSINSQAAATTGVTSDGYKLSTSVFDYWQEKKEFWQSEQRDGGQFVNFAIDYERHAQESFSNTPKESDLAAKMNSRARAGREMLFNTANGNLGDGILPSVVETLLGVASIVISGAANAVGMSGLAMLGGKAFVDIPEFWDSSSVTLPSMSYTIPLRSWSGHPVALLQNIYFPMAMWLALAAPRSAGRNSYTSPYYVKCWQKGYAQCASGLVTSLSITRGAGNVGWNAYGNPIAVDLHVTITDMSKMVHIPIGADFSAMDVFSNALIDKPISMFDEDTAFTDLMAVWASVGLSEQYYATNRWRIRTAKTKANMNTFFSMNHLLSTISSSQLGQLNSAIFYKQSASL